MNNPAIGYNVYVYMELRNGSDHEVITCYLELYEEGEVEHINGVWPSFSDFHSSWLCRKNGHTWHQCTCVPTTISTGHTTAYSTFHREPVYAPGLGGRNH